MEPCRGLWHGKCYEQNVNDNFPVLVAQDLDNSIIDDNLLEVDDPLRFKNDRGTEIT